MNRMTDLVYRPEDKNPRAAWLATACLVVALGALLPDMAGIGPRPVWQSLVLLFLSLAIFLGVRYFFSYRTYTLTYLNCRHVLLVTDTVGKRISTVCHLYLDEVAAVSAERRGEKKPFPESLKKEGRKPPLKRFIYQNTLAPEERVTLYLYDNDALRAVRLQTNDVFSAALELRLKTAQAERIADDEE